MTDAAETPGLTPAPLVRCVTARNPSPMTLAGTNTYVVGAEEADSVVVVDPGPAEGAEAHLDAVLAAAGGRRVALILVTHRHADHTGGVDHFHAATGAPVRARLPQWCRGGGAPLEDGERLVGDPLGGRRLTGRLLGGWLLGGRRAVPAVAGVELLAWHTPGHTSDSFSFVLPASGPHGAVLTGDTILGTGTTMLDHPDGTLTDYLATLRRLEAAGPLTVLPAHGPVPGPLDAVARDYRHHREGRLAQIESALEELDPDVAAAVTPAELTPRIYPGVSGRVAAVAEQTVAAHLAHLRER